MLRIKPFYPKPKAQQKSLSRLDISQASSRM